MYQFGGFLLFLSSILSFSSTSFKTEDATNPTLSTDDVSIALVIPPTNSTTYFSQCAIENKIDVVIRNQTDSIIHFYENWNSWGYYNFHFEIETPDSTYTITKTNKYWWRNFPSYSTILPNDSLIMHFNLVDSTCLVNDSSLQQTAGLNKWKGLPSRAYENAQIRVIYELPQTISYALKRRNVLKENVVRDTVFIYSQKLISEPVAIKIIKE